MARIRKAREDDVLRLGELGGALVRLHHELDPRRFFSADGIDAGYGQWLVKELARGETVLVAEDDAGRVVGYAYASVEGRDWNALLDAHGKLHDVFVDPSARRAGHARALVLAAIAELRARGAERVLLMTAALNPSAQALFRSLGFEPTMTEMMKPLDG